MRTESCRQPTSALSAVIVVGAQQPGDLRREHHLPHPVRGGVEAGVGGLERADGVAVAGRAVDVVGREHDGDARERRHEQHHEQRHRQREPALLSAQAGHEPAASDVFGSLANELAQTGLNGPDPVVLVEDDGDGDPLRVAVVIGEVELLRAR